MLCLCLLPWFIACLLGTRFLSLARFSFVASLYFSFATEVANIPLVHVTLLSPKQLFLSLTNSKAIRAVAGHHSPRGNLEMVAAHVGYLVQDLVKMYGSWHEYPEDVIHHLLGMNS
jgi:hypothetical protein